MAASCLAVGVLGALAHLAFETTVPPTPLQWLLIIALGLGPTGIAFWLWDIGTKRGNLAALGTLSYAAPVLSTGLLLAAGRATPHPTQALALALLLTGAWLSLRRPDNRWNEAAMARGAASDLGSGVRTASGATACNAVVHRSGGRMPERPPFDGQDAVSKGGRGTTALQGGAAAG